MDDLFVAHNENNLVVLSNYLEIKIVGCRRDLPSLISLSCFFMNRLPIVSCRQPKVPLKLDNHDQKYKKKKGACFIMHFQYLDPTSYFFQVCSCFEFILWTFWFWTLILLVVLVCSTPVLYLSFGLFVITTLFFFSLLGTVCQWCPTTCRTGATFSHGDSTIISSSSTTTILMPSRTR